MGAGHRGSQRRLAGAAQVQVADAERRPRQAAGTAPVPGAAETVSPGVEPLPGRGGRRRRVEGRARRGEGGEGRRPHLEGAGQGATVTVPASGGPLPPPAGPPPDRPPTGPT